MQEQTEKQNIKISVRNLVEFILRSGDIDNRKSRVMQAEAMQEGSRVHRKIQRRMGASYHAEVPLKIEIPRENYQFVIEGRADGIIKEELITIDEIKGIYMDLSYLEGPVTVHLAQAKCYAYMYAQKERFAPDVQMGVQMTYCNLDTEEIRRFVSHYTVQELADWFLGIVAEYEKWADFQYQWRCKRQASIQKLEFPFDYREGQRELASDVYRTIYRKKNLFIQAPTGTGKTMSTIYPSVRAVGEGLAEKIFYLTAKSITATVALDAFRILGGKGYQAKTVLITAKEKMCVCEEMDCNPQNCPYAEGHFDRVNDAVFELLQKEEIFTREIFLEQAHRHRVCPFELCLDTASWADNIICDYNYVFDPNVYLRRFFAEGTKEEYLFLVDEAHNLVDRGREMYSASICLNDVIETRKFVKPYSQKLWKKLGKVKKQMEELRQNCGEWKVEENAGVLPISLLSVQGELDQFLEESPAQEVVDGILDFYFEVRDFLNISELVDDNYVVYTAFDENGRFYMKLFCVNPAENLQKCLDKGNSTVFFSATLLPLQYYRKMLSTRSENFGMYVESPFEQKKRCLMICRDVSSKYTRRGYEEYRKIAEYIARMSWQKKGNYMVFFPSYRLMEDVYQVYQDEFSVSWVRCISQHASMTELEREEFLEEFTEETEETLVGRISEKI